MGETVMGLLYAIFSIFITLFFPKQITDVICYGRHRDRENIKSKKIYCLIYVFWTFFFGLFCLMMGSASGVNNTFDRVLDYYGLNFGEYDYFEAASIYDEHDYKHEGDFTLVYLSLIHIYQLFHLKAAFLQGIQPVSLQTSY